MPKSISGVAIDHAMQLQILLDCIYMNTGKTPTLNPEHTKSQKNFYFIREERTPSASLFTKNGTPFIHDFGEGVTYNYISAYAATYQVTNATAYKEILEKYIHHLPTRSKQGFKRLKIKAKSSELKTPSQRPNIKVSNRFRDYELAYFEQLGIPKKLLKSYNVFALRAYKKLKSSPTNPIFAIKISEDCYKVYQPKAKNKAYKWFWVGNKPNDFNIYGQDQLRRNRKILFITEGLKDTLTIRAHTNYDSLALDNAATKLTLNLVQDLKNRYKSIILCLDIDETGKERAKELAKEWGFQVLTLPEELQSKYHGKDVTDFFQSYDLSVFKGLPIQSFIPNRLFIKEYLAEPEAEKHLFHLFKDNQESLMIPAPTGSGKNECINRFINHEIKNGNDARFFCGFPNNISAEAKTKEYSNPKNNYSELKLNIGLLDQYTDKIERQYLDSFQVINFVYNSYSQLENLVTEQDYMFLDEPHKWITQGSIAPTTEINKILNCPAKKVLLTGTPFDSFIEEFNIKTVSIERQVNPQVKVKCVEISKYGKRSFNAKGRLKLFRLATRNLIDGLDPQEKKLHIIYLNDKQGIDKIAKVAREKGFATEVIYSDDEVKKSSEAWKCLTTSQPIPLTENQGKILFLTSLGYDSLNLNNPEEELGLFAIMGEKYIENIRQAIKRPRKAKTLEVFYFLASQKEQNPFIETYRSHRERWHRDYQKIKEDLSKYKPLELLKMSEPIRRKLINDLSGVITDDLEFNRLNCVIAYEQKKATHQTNTQKFEELKKHFQTECSNTCVSKLYQLFNNDSLPQEVNAELEKKALSNAHEIVQEGLQEEQIKIDSALKVKKLMLENVWYCLAYLISEHRVASTFKGRIKDLLGNRFDFEAPEYLAFKSKISLGRPGQRALMEYTNRLIKLSDTYQIEEHLLNLIFSKNYKSTLAQISTAHVLENIAISPRDQINKEVYQKVIQKFKVGRSYSKAERVKIIEKMYKEYEHTQFSMESHLDLFRTLFLIEEDRSNKRVRRHRICGVIHSEAIREKYHLKKATQLVSDKNQVNTLEYHDFSTEIFVGSVDDCPF